MQKKFIGWGILGAALLAWVVVAGCGGGGGGPSVVFDDPSKTPSNNVTTANASFISMGTAPACSLCHAAIVAEYALQAHGKDFTDVEGRDLTAGSCAPCHTVGFDEPSGHNDGGGTNMDLIQIQCEECHGPASTHMGNAAHINGIPDASETCWDCHVRSYKQLDNPVAPRTDADLEATIPNRVSANHPQALMLNGVYGYEFAGSTYTNSEHTGIANSCVTCHAYVPEGGVVTHGAEALEPDIEACASCHRGATSVEALHEEVEGPIKALLTQLGGEDPAAPGEPDPAAGEVTGQGLLAAWATANAIDITTNDDPTNPAVRAYKAARHNYKFVLADASFGVHNHDYAEQLLNDAIASLTTS